MAATLEKIYEVALHHYHMKLVAGREGLSNLVDWVHVVEEMDYVHFLKGRELIGIYPAGVCNGSQWSGV